MDARNAEICLLHWAVPGMCWTVLQDLGTQALWSFTSAINVYVLWNPSSAYLKMKGFLHIFCWIINKSHVPKQIKGKHSFTAFADWISLISAFRTIHEKGFLESSLSGLDFPILWIFVEPFHPVAQVFGRSVPIFRVESRVWFPTPSLPNPTGSCIRRTRLSPQINLISSFWVPEIKWVCAILSQSTSIPAL